MDGIEHRRFILFFSPNFFLFSTGNVRFIVRSTKMRICAEAYMWYVAQENPKSEEEMAEKIRYPVLKRRCPRRPIRRGH
jgi:hypothetical protein